MALIPRPDKYPEWASVDQNDPIQPFPNVQEPPTAKKQAGWFWKEPPPANWFNWILRYVYRWIIYLDDQKTNVSPIYGVDTSTTVNEIVVSFTTPVTELTDGRLFIIKVKNTVTGAATLKVDALLAKPIIDLDEDILVGGEMLANGIYMLVYSLSADKYFLQAKPDAATGWKTGDYKFSSVWSAQIGFIVYGVDSTLGNAGSGATFAAPEVYNLFVYWWNLYPGLPVDGGRGGLTADQAWTALKRLHVMPFYDRAFASVSGARGAGYMEGQRQETISLIKTVYHQHTENYAIAQRLATNTISWDNPNTNISNAQDYTGGAGGGLPADIVQPTYYTYVLVKL